MQLWLCPLFAFLLGSVPFGLIIAKLKGIDIRAHGSGNIGATNVLRVVGKKYGITCLILDALKGYLPVAVAITLIRYEGQENPMEIDSLTAWGTVLPAGQQWLAQLLQVLCGLAAILGHNYSPWVGFKGGKGIATSAGVLIALAPAAVVILLLVWLILFFTTRYVSLASIGAAAVLPPLILFGSWFHGKLAAGTWNKPLLVFSIVIAALAIWKHRSNLQRLRDGTEHRFSRKSKNA
ncbi:glycerol-3-phosphate acyltransferase PlsY [Haloferula luteola]|uniref:Glycerol-3-phosphate acyltransferase n=1 Tax=Haloferula luteola TaxID=595692 RepID=A0A840VDY8_9BACT|nr:glycerol-3-phosphate 1-O-acyltransferase PlsY [Haloferula luteola]MBB5352049.1 glycerol-3-phosphate acyltransferase PlsY [Haloferula luteola]